MLNLLEAEKEAQSRANRLIVYGTLRRGESNHGLLRQSKFLGTVVIPASAGYALITVADGAFPAVVRADEAGLEPSKIVGELYAVSDQTMMQTDVLEGYPVMYRREKVTVKNRGKNTIARIYVGNGQFFGFDEITEDDQIESGDWTDYTQKRHQELDQQIEKEALGTTSQQDEK